MESQTKKNKLTFWCLVWGLGITGQLCWNIENQWYNTFIYAKIAKDPTIISWMVAISALATTISTFLFGTISDRRGRRKRIIAFGYIFWGIFAILFGLTQYITHGLVTAHTKIFLVAGFAVVMADAIMSFFGSMGNDVGLQAWVNDHMNDSNRGQLGAALATQPIIGTIAGTVLGGLLVGENDNYLRLFIVMGCVVILFGFIALIFMKDSEDLQPSVKGTFSHQFFSVFNFKKYVQLKELAWVNLTLSVFFIAFNMYFTHLGNYMIYYLGFTADKMGYIEGISLLLAMLATIPATKLINQDKSPFICVISIGINFLGLLLLGFFIRPENVNTESILNPVLLLGVFLIGLGYVLFLQTVTVWSKQLYPKKARGQFEGIRILFFVLIPMVAAPMLSNPLIKRSGKFIDENGFTSYLPTHTLFLAASVLVLLTLIPLYFARYWHNKTAKNK